MSAFGTYRCVSWQMIPRTQVIRMPQRILPLTSFARRTAVTRIPIRASKYGDSLRGEGPFCYRRFEGKDAYQCGIISNNDLGILQSDECDKETDTYGYCVFQVHRNGVEDRFTYIGKRKQDKNDTFCEDCCKCLLPGVSHTENYCVGKVCVQSHTGSKNERIVGQKRHQTGGNECGKCGGGEDSSRGPFRKQTGCLD